MGHLQKITHKLAPAILEEIERTLDEAGKFNPETHEINPALTSLNYSLTNRDMSALEYLNQRLSEVKVQKRADVNILGQWVWTMPKDLDPKYQEDFFRETYNFYVSEFGKENICYATVHLDETAPHMHIGIIPTVKLDKPRKDGKTEKVCAKDVFTPMYLQTAHANLQCYLEEKLRVPVNLLNGDTLGVDGIKNYKRAKDLIKQTTMLQENVESLEAEIAEKRAVLRQLDKAILSKQGEVASLDREIDVQHGILAKLKEKIKEVKESIKGIAEALVGHPNMLKMFYHWLTDGKESELERDDTVNEYQDYLEKYDLTLADTDKSIEDIEDDIKSYKKAHNRGLER